MKKALLFLAVLMVGGSVFLTMGAQSATAQGPAGAGASTAAQGSSSSSSSKGHSLNPIKWVKKDKNSGSADAGGSRSEIEKKLTPKLHTQGLLAADANATDACAPFTALNECLAALHASKNLGLEFNCLRAKVTGVHTNVNLSGCKGSVGDKAMGLNKAIHELNSSADAKGAKKNAEQQAKDDLKNLGA